MAKVSIIVPVYNTEKYISKCLDSLLLQTLQDIEIIIVDDGSTDNSCKIISQYNSKYPNKIIYLKKNNGGLSDARNYALPFASGDYIGFVDSDDYVDNDMFLKMYNCAKKSNLDLVECNFVWEFAQHSKNDYGKNSLDDFSFFTDGRVMSCNKLFKAKIIHENNLQFPTGLRYEDVEFFYKFIPFVKNYELIDDILYHYVQRDNSIANNQNEKNKDIFNILNNIISFYKVLRLYDNYKYQLEYLYIRLLLGSSFLRIVKIKDKNIRKDLLNKTLSELYSNFPNWRKNKLLKNNKTLKNLYYKSINKFTFKIYSFVFHI